jgi:hypothetical protein
MSECGCTGPHVARRIVLAGGPGAGKTAVLEVMRRAMCHHVHVLPESWRERRAVLGAAKGTPGVRRIDDQLRIQA